MRPLNQWLRESTLVRLVLGFALAACILAALGWVVTGPYRGGPLAFDTSIRLAMRQIQSPMWTALFLTVTRLGSTLFLTIIGVAVAIVFIVLRWFRPLILFITLMTGQAILDRGFKWYFARPRPAALINYNPVESFSFPSGHAISSLCLYGAIAWIVATRIENSAAKAGIAISAAILIFLIGVSRVYIGVHYPTDVIGGFLAAAIWTVAVMSADRKTI